MPPKVYGATADEVAEVHALMHDTFERTRPDGPHRRFYESYDICDPEFRPEQYRFRRLRGKVASALKLYVRRLRHPDGEVPVTVMGGVCTQEKLRGRGLLGPVIVDSLDYSRSIGAKAMIIVTPRRNYYLRHGFTYATTHDRAGIVPEHALKGAHFEPIVEDDAGWMTEVWNSASYGYGPILRSEKYTRLWIVKLRLGWAGQCGYKLVRRGKPAAYGIFDFRQKPMRVMEAASRRNDGRDEAALLSFTRHLGARRFVAHMPARHPLMTRLKADGVRLRATSIERYMHCALDDTFPIPDADFCYSWLDFV